MIISKMEEIVREYRAAERSLEALRYIQNNAIKWIIPNPTNEARNLMGAYSDPELRNILEDALRIGLESRINGLIEQIRKLEELQ